MNAGREELLLARMRESVEAIAAYTHGLTREQFLEKQLVQDAVYMRIMALSECAAKLLQCNPSLEGNYPEMRWAELIALRNRLAHDYFGILPERIWNAVEESMPVASTVIATLCAEFLSPGS